MMLTDRDYEILNTLLRKARLLTLGQVAGTWWRGHQELAGRRLRKLSDSGWLVGERVLARPILPLAAPLFAWGPPGAAPDFESLSWRAQSRWKSPSVPTAAWHASPTAAARLGGSGRRTIKNLCQVTHDLHVGEIFLGLLRQADPRAAEWVGEDAHPEGLVAPLVPDALLVRGGKVIGAVEFGGAYPPRRFETFHEHCRAMKLPYEIW